ncbi:hypothetical protein HPP92_027372 [Vanilla planifolia]|uniref:Uncharacterized protein n=1 Tax=Vanilla planifolia TaxID=51239 RepID=A0A835P910_VANPL|nr:hypothetical protein HPP92_027372 [Vanilla planifolia]
MQEKYGQAQQETEKLRRQMEKLKKKHAMEMATMKHYLAESRLPESALEPLDYYEKNINPLPDDDINCYRVKGITVHLLPFFPEALKELPQGAAALNVAIAASHLILIRAERFAVFLVAVTGPRTALAPGLFLQFLSYILFSNDDIPKLVAEAAGEHSGISYIITAPLGLHELMVDVMNDRIKHCLSHVTGDAEECSTCADLIAKLKQSASLMGLLQKCVEKRCPSWPCFFLQRDATADPKEWPESRCLSFNRRDQVTNSLHLRFQNARFDEGHSESNGGQV